MAAEYVARIGARIAERREELGMTQRDLAELIPGKTDGNQVSKWERGIHKPSDDTLEQIATALKTTATYFLIQEPTPNDVVLLGSSVTFEDGETIEWRAQLDRVEAKLNAIMDHLSLSLSETPADVAESAARRRASKPRAAGSSRQPRKGKDQAA